MIGYWSGLGSLLLILLVAVLCGPTAKAITPLPFPLPLLPVCYLNSSIYTLYHALPFLSSLFLSLPLSRSPSSSISCSFFSHSLLRSLLTHSLTLSLSLSLSLFSSHILSGSLLHYHLFFLFVSLFL